MIWNARPTESPYVPGPRCGPCRRRPSDRDLDRGADQGGGLAAVDPEPVSRRSSGVPPPPGPSPDRRSSRSRRRRLPGPRSTGPPSGQTRGGGSGRRRPGTRASAAHRRPGSPSPLRTSDGSWRGTAQVVVVEGRQDHHGSANRCGSSRSRREREDLLPPGRRSAAGGEGQDRPQRLPPGKREYCIARRNGRRDAAGPGSSRRRARRRAVLARQVGREVDHGPSGAVGIGRVVTRLVERDQLQVALLALGQQNRSASAPRPGGGAEARELDPLLERRNDSSSGRSPPSSSWTIRSRRPIDCSNPCSRPVFLPRAMLHLLGDRRDGALQSAPVQPHLDGSTPAAQPRPP